jgi:hypothetical protein
MLLGDDEGLYRCSATLNMVSAGLAKTMNVSWGRRQSWTCPSGCL